MIEPFMKAVGGKRRVAERLAAEIEALDPALYVEAFAGGGAVALALRPSIPKLIADANPAVIAVWAAIKEQPPERLLEELGRLYKVYPDTAFGYAQARDELNTCLGSKPINPGLRFAALVLYINVRCYNGLWRVNQEGFFNVPWNKQQSSRRLTLNELRIYQEVLKNVEVHCADFREVFGELLDRPRSDRSRTVIYADPPYDAMFGDYTVGGFGEGDQHALATWLKYLAERGMKILTTNADTPLICKLYAWAKIEYLDERHSVGPTAGERGTKRCLLIKGY